MSNLLITIARLINFLISVYIWIIVIRALVSWFNPDPHSRLVRLIVDLTEPVLKPVRSLLPHMRGIDLSPLIVLIILYFARLFISSIMILDFGMRIH